MTATTTKRNTPCLEEAKYYETIERNVADGLEVLAGTQVALNNANEFIDAGGTNHTRTVGRAQRTVKADDTYRSLRVDGGIFKWENGGDIQADDIGKLVGSPDNQTVSLATASSKPGGVVYDLDAYGVWVIQGLSVTVQGAQGPTGPTGPTG